MGFLLFLFACITVAGAVAAVTMRHLIHGALCLAASLMGLALLYLHLGAQFLGLAQVLVYVGAVAILIVIAVLLTRGAEVAREEPWSGHPWLGAGIAVAVFLALGIAVLSSDVGASWDEPAPDAGAQASVIRIGVALMTDHVVSLLAMGVLLTAALIGAVLIAMKEET